MPLTYLLRRLVVLAVASIALTSCSIITRGGPHQPPMTSAPPSVTARTLPTLPTRLGLGARGLRLPGAVMNSRGTIRAVVFPVTVGERFPLWTDSLIAHDLVGTHRLPTPRAAAGFLASASNGLLRLEASVFPPLIEAGLSPDAISDQVLTPEGVQGLVERVIQKWGSRVNLAMYDNDGPDGQPMSGDDDGFIDLPIILLETDSTPAIVHVPLRMTLPAGRGGRLRVRTNVAHLVAVPRNHRGDGVYMGLVSVVLGAAGLANDEMFFPPTFKRSISTLARLRLGWIGGDLVTSSGDYVIQPGIALAVPLLDVDSNRGLWLVEQENDAIYLTRVARRLDGHFATVETRQILPGDAEVVIPLTASEGEVGARMRVEWPAGGIPLAIVALTERAIREDDDRREGSK